MHDVALCAGPLLWYTVPDADGLTSHGLIECGTCGWFTVAGNRPDDRHADTVVVMADE